MRRADLLIGIGLLVFAGLYYQQSQHIVRGFASDRLGPTFFPRLLALALTVLAAVLVVRAGSGRSDPTPLPPMQRGLLLAVILLTVAYAFVLPFLGFLIATPLLLGTVIRLLGLRRWGTVIGTALGITVVLYLTFGRALDVLLPLGPLGAR